MKRIEFIEQKDTIAIQKSEWDLILSGEKWALFQNDITLSEEQKIENNDPATNPYIIYTGKYIYFKDNETGKILGQAIVDETYFLLYESGKGNDLNHELVYARNEAIKGIYYSWCTKNSLNPNHKEGWFKSKKFSAYLDKIGWGGNYALFLTHIVEYETESVSSHLKGNSKIFVNYNLREIKSGKVSLNKEVQEDVMLIVQSFENECIDITNWSLFEIATTHRTYGFENKNNMVYMEVTSTGKVIPRYFKNHDLNGYSTFVADSINEAIKLYEKTYKPKSQDTSIELDELKTYTDEQMKTYRLGYDYVFNASKPFTYQGDDLLGLSIDVLFMVFDKKGNEIFFESEELSDQKFNFGNGNLFYLFDVINCSFDTKKFLNFKPDFEIISKIGDYVVQYQVDSYYKDIKGELLGFPCAEPAKISKDDFIDIMKNNIEIFNNPDNYQAQSTAYFTQEIIT